MQDLYRILSRVFLVIHLFIINFQGAIIKMFVQIMVYLSIFIYSLGSAALMYLNVPIDMIDSSDN